MEPLASDFDYPLDPALIAQQPLARRDESRLMVLSRRTGQTELRVFADLPSLFRPGDLLVVNDTRVIPARFFCRRGSGGRIEGLFLRQVRKNCGLRIADCGLPKRERRGSGDGDPPMPGQRMRQQESPQLPGGQDAPSGVWVVLLKGANRCRIGERVELIGGGAVELELLAKQGDGQWLAASHPPAPAAEVLARAGHTPLPPYIRRGGEARDAEPLEGEQADRDRYQTVYAAADGAVAAPTAGLHFTPELIEALRAGGVETAAVTLHVGLGTFAPVKVENLAEHRMHGEWYEMPAATALALNAARGAGRRIVAVGTTSVRVLESVISPEGLFEPASGWTDIFIYPPAEFRATDALITNFHLPRSTLLMLVSAFCRPGGMGGIEMIRTAYARAAAEKFRFFSYGDAMFIE